jgi:hypothetical protein
MDIVLRHPELLEDATIEMLSRLAEETDERGKPIVESLLAVLMECRAVGIDAAFENFEPAAPGRDLTEDIASLITANDAADMTAAVEQCPELLGEAAVRRLSEMEANSSAYTADRMYAIIQFLRAYRRGDTVAACAAYDRDVAEVDDANRLAAEYTFLEDPVAEAEFLRAHPVLLRRQAERALASAAEAESEAEPAVAAFGSRARTKLHALRRLRADDNAGQ